MNEHETPFHLYNDVHGEEGGPRRLVSVRGSKYCNAPSVAKKVLLRLYKERWGALGLRPDSGRPKPFDAIDLQEPHQMLRMGDVELGAVLDRIIDEESVVHLDDLLLRRTDWLLDSNYEEQVTKRVRELLPNLT